jgi:hypothetical protein
MATNSHTLKVPIRRMDGESRRGGRATTQASPASPGARIHGIPMASEAPSTATPIREARCRDKTITDKVATTNTTVDRCPASTITAISSPRATGRNSVTNAGIRLAEPLEITDTRDPLTPTCPTFQAAHYHWMQKRALSAARKPRIWPGTIKFIDNPILHETHRVQSERLVSPATF